MGFFSGLNREQKEAVGLLQIGTFLEYFDLMLYVHMAVLLNELFFPKTDPHTAALVSAFAFCSTYLLRPFGALIFGWLGDNIGRKSTVVITTLMMAISCIVMASLPTYAQIGLTATCAVTVCRILQGLSSMGEIMGATVYVTEIVKRPEQYFAVGLITISSLLGGVAALGVSSLVTNFSMDWRIAFWIGACVAVVGSVARTRLRETPDFLEAKNARAASLKEPLIVKNFKTTTIKYFFIECAHPLFFYLTYMYFNHSLKEFGYTSQKIITQNFIVSIIAFFAFVVYMFLTKRIHPLKILNFKAIVALVLIVLFPFLATYANSGTFIFCIQVLLVMFPLGKFPANSIFVSAFPVRRRVTTTSFVYAAARACMYIVISFSLVYLTSVFGHWGIWIVAIPTFVAFMSGVRHFEVLEGLRPGNDSQEQKLEYGRVA